MQYVFVDDGYPEANDYATNYEPVTIGRSAVRANAGIRVPVAARPAWWTVLTCVLRVMVPGGRGPAGCPALRVAHES